MRCFNTVFGYSPHQSLEFLMGGFIGIAVLIAFVSKANSDEIINEEMSSPNYSNFTSTNLGIRMK